MIPVQSLLAQVGCELGLLCAPVGPGDPFGSFWLAVADTLRLACCLGALVVVALATLVARRDRPDPATQAVLAAVCLFCLSVIGTELDRLGDFAHYRLLVNAAAVGLALAALWRRRRPAHATETSGRHAR